MFHLVSLSFANFPGRIPLPGALACVWVFGCFVFCLCVLLVSCFQGNLISILLKIPVVDRPCLALARQCRKKNSCYDERSIDQKKAPVMTKHKLLHEANNRYLQMVGQLTEAQTTESRGHSPDCSACDDKT